MDVCTSKPSSESKITSTLKHVANRTQKKMTLCNFIVCRNVTSAATPTDAIRRNSLATSLVLKKKKKKEVKWHFHSTDKLTFRDAFTGFVTADSAGSDGGVKFTGCRL